MNGNAPDPANIQANILRGSSRWTWACYVFVRFEGPDAIAELVSELLAGGHVGTARSGYQNTPNVNVNLAFSHDGLMVAEMPLSDGARYERNFLMRPRHHESEDADATDAPLVSAFEGGMRSADLGDPWPSNVDGAYRWPQRDDGKERWPGHGVATAWWTEDAEQKSWEGVDAWPHLLIWISAVSKKRRKRALQAVRLAIESTVGATEIGCQRANALDGCMEHFGFVDGVSQPAIEGFRPGNPGDGKISARGWQSLPVGEFIIGYPDEGFGPPDRLDLAPLAKDGTFLVYRKLRQDVAAFRAASHEMAASSDTSSQEIEEKMMGRRHDGTPLVVPPGAPEPPASRSLRNDFTFSNDVDGARCPLGSHVRRANPRDDLHFEGRRVNRHRIIRRGMTYGKPYEPGDDDGDRGLIFIAFNARIEDQFEFIQKQWLNDGRTFRLGADADPIAGNGSNIRIVVNGEQPILRSQPMPFTQFLGGDYFFVPSLSMLAQIASGTARQAVLAAQPPTEA